MLRRWCWTSTSDASLSVFYKSCCCSPAQVKTITAQEVALNPTVYCKLGMPNEVKLSLLSTSYSIIEFLTEVAFTLSYKLHKIHPMQKNISLCVILYYLLDMNFKSRIRHFLESSIFPFWMLNCIYLSKSGQSVYV